MYDKTSRLRLGQPTVARLEHIHDMNSPADMTAQQNVTPPNERALPFIVLPSSTSSSSRFWRRRTTTLCHLSSLSTSSAYTVCRVTQTHIVNNTPTIKLEARGDVMLVCFTCIQLPHARHNVPSWGVRPSSARWIPLMVCYETAISHWLLKLCSCCHSEKHRVLSLALSFILYCYIPSTQSVSVIMSRNRVSYDAIKRSHTSRG